MNRERIVNLTGEINELSALATIVALLDYNSRDKKEPIYLYINSPGGSIIHGLAIYDCIKHIDAPVYTFCVGLCASMGAFLLSCGEKGSRYALAHSRILIHQPLIGGSSFALKESEAREMANRLIDSRNLLEEIMAKNTNQPLEKLHADCERDNWMTPEEAKEYGLIDVIV